MYRVLFTVISKFFVLNSLFLVLVVVLFILVRVAEVSYEELDVIEFEPKLR